MTYIPPRVAKARILIVDDVAFNRTLISSTLKKAGFLDLVLAEDGQEALEKTYQNEPSLVILDLDMPKLDGFGYCEAVRKDLKLPRIPIIAQTIIEERETKLRALSCGADDFVNKPLDQDELVLRSCLHLQRYFNTRDLEVMQEYLKMELDQAKDAIYHLQQTASDPSTLRWLQRHNEILETLTILPPFTEAAV